jgi:hypothetical protein
MKIFSFTPQIQQSPGSIKEQASRRSGSNNVNDFETQFLRKFSQPSQVVDKITKENVLASQTVSLEDLDQAGSLLSTLLDQINCSGPAALQEVHNLDGILYYFQT